MADIIHFINVSSVDWLMTSKKVIVVSSRKASVSYSLTTQRRILPLKHSFSMQEITMVFSWIMHIYRLGPFHSRMKDFHADRFKTAVFMEGFHGAHCFGFILEGNQILLL
jgi:hypothetical protein